MRRLVIAPLATHNTQLPSKDTPSRSVAHVQLEIAALATAIASEKTCREVSPLEKAAAFELCSASAGKTTAVMCAQIKSEQHKHAGSTQHHSQDKKNSAKAFSMATTSSLFTLGVLCAAAILLDIVIKSLVLCLRDCASYPSPGATRFGRPALRSVFSSAFHLRLLK